MYSNFYLIICVREQPKVSPKNVFLINTPYEKALKEIRIGTKALRPLLIGCKGSLVMGVTFLPSSFKIPTLV